MKNKKILIIALFLIFFCLLGYSKCFAYDLKGNNCTLNIPDELYQKIISNDYYKQYSCIFVMRSLSCYDVIYIKSKDGLYFYIEGNSVSSSTTFDGVSVSYNLSDLSVRGGDTFTNFTMGGWTYSGSLYNGTYNFYLRNLDLYADKNKENCLFHTAPQGIVAQQVEQVKMSQVQAEILGILPLTLVVVVSLVGLRKGLKMLETFLRQS